MCVGVCVCVRVRVCVAVPLRMRPVLSSGGKCVELLSPLGAITGIADARNRFIVKKIIPLNN